MSNRSPSNTMPVSPQNIGNSSDHSNSDSSILEKQPNLQEVINRYNKALEIEQIKLKNLENERKILEKKKVSLDLELEQITKKHSIFEEDFQAFSLFMNELGLFSTIKETNQIIKNIGLKKTTLIAQIEELTRLIARQGTKNTSTHLNKILSLRAYIDNLNDMMKVTLGEKYYAKADGTKATSFEEAYYILDQDQRIVIEQGSCYLLRGGNS